MRRRSILGLAMIATCLLLPGCDATQKTDGTTRVGIDRDVVRAELSALLDDYEEMLNSSGGDPELAKQIHEGREIAKRVIEGIEHLGDGQIEEELRALDAVALVAIGAIEDPAKRMAARVGYRLARRAIVQAGVALRPAPPEIVG